MKASNRQPVAEAAETFRPPPPQSPSASELDEPVSWWPRASVAERVVQLAAMAVCWSLLVVAWHLEPAPEGLGTHQQLGLQPCGFYRMTGRPCPGCGLTTAFALMAHGRVVEGVVVQPFGAVLFVLTVAAAVTVPVTLLLGRSWNLILLRINAPVWLYALVFLALAAWIYKIVHGQVTGGFGP
ncbi:MAG: DUF2752 domain-containing protein [Anaerolineaceae bacterium]|nr:DUF2752 domain-containing protein [Anaerolineaceae bacterium]